jgi:rubrerythrin
MMTKYFDTVDELMRELKSETKDTEETDVMKNLMLCPNCGGPTQEMIRDRGSCPKCELSKEQMDAWLWRFGPNNRSKGNKEC